MKRISNRTRANFEKLYGMYPFSVGGRFSIIYEMARSHELREYHVKMADKGAYVGESGDDMVSEMTVKDHLMYMPEKDIRQLGATIVEFKELKKWIEDELSRRHLPKNPKSKSSAKKHIKHAIESGVLKPASSLVKNRSAGYENARGGR